jgi:transposase
MQAPFILEGAVNTLAFEADVEQVLAPSLKPGQVVVLDNLSAHTSEQVRQAITRQGGQILWLPTHSPDLTPIEVAFSQLNASLRARGDAPA